ncbi:MAG: hypothetical protein ACQEQL_08135 [Pseudomonadota bacterium]
MGIKEHINYVSGRAEKPKKTGNVLNPKLAANRIHAKPETPKKDILNAIASRQAPKAAAPQTAPKAKPKQPGRGM